MGPPAPSTTVAAGAVPPSTVPAPPTTAGAPPAQGGAGAAPVLVSPRGVVVAVTGRDRSGWKVRTPCGNAATLARGTPVTAATVVLDPGHGGAEPGAVGPGRFAEAPLNLAVSKAAAAALTRAGVAVVLTRTGEYQASLASRTQIVNALRPAAFVSVHHNAEPDGPFPRPGTETYYQIGSATSKRLAGLVYEEVVRALSAYPVAWVADTDAGAKYRPGEHGDYYAVLRQTAGLTSVLAELAFVSDPPEASLLARPDVQQVEGEAVARGILRYLGTQDSGSGFTEPYPRVTPPTPPGGGGPETCTDPEL